MAKSRKRSETASQGQAAVAPDEGTNGQHAPNVGGDARDRIALRAYELYLARGGADGGDFDDWLAAERELIGATPESESESDRGE
jgi:Protein of unknown function (DUF2934)